MTGSIRPTVAEYAAVLVLVAASPVTHAQANADSSFERIAEAFVDDLPAISPIRATLTGDHRRDGVLDRVDGSGRDAVRKIYKSHLADLRKIDRKSLSRANQVDADLLQNELASRLWQLDTLQEWAWNPLVYVDLSGSALYGLMARDFAPLPERLESAASRLERLPRFLDQARSALQAQRVPKIHAETAIQQNPGLTSIIEKMIEPQLDTVSGEFKIRLQAAIATAKSAVGDHQTWLEVELLPKAAGDFRIGPLLFDTKLGFTLNSPLRRRDIRTRAENEYVAVRDQMYRVSKDIYSQQYPFTSFPDNPDEAYRQAIIRAALEKAYQELPEPDAIVDIARQYLQQATEFVRQKNLVTVPDEPIDIIVMPEFQRGVTLAYLDAPGPLDRGQKSFYAVAPPPTDWNAEQLKSFLREYNLLSIQNLTLHEAVPGHYLQLALSNRYPSVLRSVFSSGPFIEGWAVYGERFMVDEGYLGGDPLMRLIMLKWYLRAVTNAIIDQAIHVEGMTREAAMQLMIEGGFQEEREAAAKWVRAQLTSTQLSTYFVGYQEHVDMRQAVERAWGEEFTLRRYHDQALSYGSPAVKHVRALMLNDRIPYQTP